MSAKPFKPGGSQSRLPVLPLPRAVLFPGGRMLVASIESLGPAERRRAEAGELPVVAVVPCDAPGGRLAAVGTAAEILGLQRLPDGRTGAIVKGVERLKVVGTTRKGERVTAIVSPLAATGAARTARFEAALRALKKTAIRVASLHGSLFDEARALLTSTDDAAHVCDVAQGFLSCSYEEKVKALAEPDLTRRMTLTQAALARELEYLKLAEDIRRKATAEIDATKRQDYLREQVRVLKAELGEDQEPDDELDQLETDLERLELPDVVREAVDRELDRMRLMAPGSSEYMVSYSYVTWFRDLPWDEEGIQPPLPLGEARRLLDREHYGLEQVKERILEYLAVMRHRKAAKGEILLLAGPPGVGKTTLARSVAAALNRPFVRVSLGGVKDEAELRGHRRTYVGSMPGKIIQALKQAGSTAPLILLDEIDKMGLDYGRGAMASAMLEILDEEQNKAFVDHYLAVPYDLSKVVFMATANTVGSIPRPLLDRMETIELTSYSEREKLAIATRHLVPEVRKDLGLPRAKFNPSERLLLSVIRDYTRESGVRQLKRDLATIGRKVVKGLVMGGRTAVKIAPEALGTLLGPPRYHAEPNDARLVPGVAVGLAYTAVGGDILYIESSRGLAATPGREGRLKLTGSLGKVMRESAEAAVSYLVGICQARPGVLGLDPAELVATNLHLHFPDGATPKDGPSAGVAIMCAIASLMTGRSLPARLAMTGEITLRGQVLPVGGIKEKLLAAHRYGKRRVLIPAANVHDLAHVPREVLDELEVVPVRTMDEALRHAGLSQEDAPSALRRTSRGTPRPRLAAIAGPQNARP